MSSTPKKSSTSTQSTATQHSGHPNVDYAAVFNASAAATSRPWGSDLGHVWGSAPNAGVQASTSAPTAAPANSQAGTVTAAQLFNNATNTSGAPAAAADLAHFWGPGAAKRNT